MDSKNSRVRVIVGLLIALSGLRGFVIYESGWMRALFVLAILSGLWTAAMGVRHREAE